MGVVFEALGTRGRGRGEKTSPVEYELSKQLEYGCGDGRIVEPDVQGVEEYFRVVGVAEMVVKDCRGWDHRLIVGFYF